MPYWSIFCLYCGGYIADALLECIPAWRRGNVAYRELFQGRPGAAIACPYCNGLIGFDQDGRPAVAESGWPVFRYGRTELEIKKAADGESPDTSLAHSALRHRFQRPGLYEPFRDYTYAEQASPDETVS